MSEVARGAGWWLAADGFWYPPEDHPRYVAPPVPGPPRVPGWAVAVGSLIVVLSLVSAFVYGRRDLPVRIEDQVAVAEDPAVTTEPGGTLGEDPPGPDDDADERLDPSAYGSGEVVSGTTGAGTDYRGLDVADVAFRDADLRNADFTDARIERSLFDVVDAVGVPFAGVDVGADGAAFVASDLAGADFGGATLDRSLFIDSDLTGVNFADASLDGVAFFDSDLSGAVLTVEQANAVGSWLGSTCPDGVEAPTDGCRDHLG